MDLEPGARVDIDGQPWRVVPDPDQEAEVAGIAAIEDPDGRVGYLGRSPDGSWRAWTPPAPVDTSVRLIGRQGRSWRFTRIRTAFS